MKITINRPHDIIEALILLLAILLFVGFVIAVIIVALALLTLSLPAVGTAGILYLLHKVLKKQ